MTLSYITRMIWSRETGVGHSFNSSHTCNSYRSWDQEDSIYSGVSVLVGEMRVRDSDISLDTSKFR